MLSDWACVMSSTPREVSGLELCGFEVSGKNCTLGPDSIKKLASWNSSCVPSFFVTGCVVADAKRNTNIPTAFSCLIVSALWMTDGIFLDTSSVSNSLTDDDLLLTSLRKEKQRLKGVPGICSKFYFKFRHEYERRQVSGPQKSSGTEAYSSASCHTECV